MLGGAAEGRLAARRGCDRQLEKARRFLLGGSSFVLSSWPGRQLSAKWRSDAEAPLLLLSSTWARRSTGRARVGRREPRSQPGQADRDGPRILFC
jgi:hypothetical protein